MPGRSRVLLPRWSVALVRGRSMEPTLYDGDRLLVRREAVPRVGDVVVVRLPSGVLAIKRAARRELGAWWVERDNPTMGVDSWSVGPIPDGDVVAVAVSRLWPLRRARLHRD